MPLHRPPCCFLSSLLISIIVAGVLLVLPHAAHAADCTTFTSTTVDIKSSECSNYIFGTHSGLAITCTDQTLDGIYFTGTCTGCTITITGSTIKNGIIGMPSAKFDGGAITVSTSSAQMIALDGVAFANNPAVDLRHNTVVFDSATAVQQLPSGVSGALPVIALGLRGRGAITIGAVTFVNNKVTVTDSSNKMTHGILLFGQENSKGNGQILVYGNAVQCSGCMLAGLEVSLTPKAASDSDKSQPYALLTFNFTMDANAVDATLTGVGDIFSACYVRSSGYLADKTRVSMNTCRAHGSGRFNKVFGLRLAAPTTSASVVMFTIKFGACAEVGSLTITKNTASAGTHDSDKPLTATQFAYGLYVADFVSKTVVMDENTAEANNPASVAYGAAYAAMCVDQSSKFWTSDWGACPSLFACAAFSCIDGKTCPLGKIAIEINKNALRATGGNGEVIGWWFPGWAMRYQQPLMGNTVALPFKFEPYNFKDNTVVVSSVNSNRTRGVLYGFEELGTLPSPAMVSTGNKITVTCTGTFPATPGKIGTRKVPAVCQGDVLLQGLPGEAFKDIPSMLLGYVIAWPFITDQTNTMGNDITVTCGAGFQQCNGLYMQTEQYSKKNIMAWGTMKIRQIELGDPAPLFAVGEIDVNAAMKRSGPIGMHRYKGTGNSFVSAAITCANLHLQLTQRGIGTRAAEFRRSLVYFDPAALLSMQLTVSTSATFSFLRYFVQRAAEQTYAPTVFAFPFADPVVAGKLSVSNAVARHDDLCDVGSGGTLKRCNWGGPYARVISASPAGSRITDTKFSVQFAPAKLDGRMRRRCGGFFSPALTTACNGCTLNLGCEGCQDFWTGLESSAAGWSRTFDTRWCPPPNTLSLSKTFAEPLPPPAPSKTRHITISTTLSGREPTRTMSSALTTTKSVTQIVIIPSYTDTYSPTATPALTETVSEPITVSPTLTWTRSPPPTKSATVTYSKSPSPSLSVPDCAKGMWLSATIMGKMTKTARAVDREPIVIQLRLNPPPNGALDVRWDAFSPNVTKDHVELVPIPSDAAAGAAASGSEDGGDAAGGAQLPEILKVQSRTLRIIDVTVMAAPGTNIFAQDVGAMFAIDNDMLLCRWRGGTGNSSTIQSAPAIFPRRFDFVAAATSQAFLALGLLSMYFQAIFSGSSGITLWLAARRSIGFFDAVSCVQKKDSAMVAIDSPLQLKIGGGDDYLAVARGALIGNTILVCIFGVFCLGASVYRSRKTWAPMFSNEAQSWAGAPAWIFPISAILLPGTVQAIVELVANKDGLDIGLCIGFGAIDLAAPMVVAWHVLLRGAPNHFWSFVAEKFTAEMKLVEMEKKKEKEKKKKSAKEDDPDQREEEWEGDHNNNNNDHDDDDGDEDARSHRSSEKSYRRDAGNNNRRSGSQWSSSSRNRDRNRSGGGRLSRSEEDVLGDDDDEQRNDNDSAPEEHGVTKEWVPVAPPSWLTRLFVPVTVFKTRREHFANRYGTAFDRNCGRIYWVTVAETLISLASSIVAGWPGVRSDHSAGCRTSIVAHCCLLTFGVLLAIQMPFTVLFDNVFILIVYALGVSNAILQIVGDYQDNLGLSLAADRVVFTILVVCFAKGVIDILRFWRIKESRTWAVCRVIAFVTRKHAKREERRLARLAAIGQEMTDRERQRQEEQEQQERRRRDELLNAPILPPETPLDPEDLVQERRRRRELAEPLFDELMPLSARSRNRIMNNNSSSQQQQQQQQQQHHHHHAFNLAPNSSNSRRTTTANTPRAPAANYSMLQFVRTFQGSEPLPSSSAAVAAAAAAAARRSAASPVAVVRPSDVLATVLDSDSDDGSRWFHSQQQQNKQRRGHTHASSPQPLSGRATGASSHSPQPQHRASSSNRAASPVPPSSPARLKRG